MKLKAFIVMIVVVMFTLSSPVRAEIQLTPVILQFQSDGTHTISQEVPPGATLSSALSCTPAEVLKRYPDMTQSQNKVASCANVHETLDSLYYAKNAADIAVIALDQRIEAQKISLAELNTLKYNDTFPSITISPSGYETITDIPGISDIAPQCVSASNKSQLEFVGKRNPVFTSTPSLDSISLVYLNLYKQYQGLIESWTNAKDQKAKTKVEDAIGTFIDGNKAIAMVNTDAGLAKIDASTKRTLKDYSLHVSGAYNPTASCGVTGWLPGKVKFQAYDIYVDSFTKTKCLPFEIAKGMVTGQINGKLKEFNALRDKFAGISAQKQMTIDKIISGNKECLTGKTTANIEFQTYTKPAPVTKPASSDAMKVIPRVIVPVTPSPTYTPVYYPVTTSYPTPTVVPTPTPIQTTTPPPLPTPSPVVSSSPPVYSSPTPYFSASPYSSPISSTYNKHNFLSTVIYSFADLLDAIFK